MDRHVSYACVYTHLESSFVIRRSSHYASVPTSHHIPHFSAITTPATAHSRSNPTSAYYFRGIFSKGTQLKCLLDSPCHPATDILLEPFMLIHSTYLVDLPQRLTAFRLPKCCSVVAADLATRLQRNCHLLRLQRTTRQRQLKRFLPFPRIFPKLPSMEPEVLTIVTTPTTHHQISRKGIVGNRPRREHPQVGKLASPRSEPTQLTHMLPLKAMHLRFSCRQLASQSWIVPSRRRKWLHQQLELKHSGLTKRRQDKYGSETTVRGSRYPRRSCLMITPPGK